MSKPKMNMKLLIDKSKGKVIFAEAGEECVDFLFHMLSLPLGSVVGFPTKKSMSGSIGTLYGSLVGLGNDFMQEAYRKRCLLRPKSAVASPATKKLYSCNRDCYSQRHLYVSDGPGATCPTCGSQMTKGATYVTPPPAAAKNTGESSTGGGYVKGMVTYMITDDLSVQPMSTISSITLLNKFNIQHAGLLEEKNVTLDANLGLSLLQASLTSKTVLTDTFLSRRYY